MCQTLSFVFDLLCLRFSILPGSPLDFGALDKRIGQRAIARKNQCDLGKSCPSYSFFGLLHQAGAVESYTISSVFLEKNEDAFVGATFSTRTPGSWKLH